MARVKQTAKLIDSEEIDEETEDVAQQSEGEDLTLVDTDPSKLMGREKPKATL